MTTLTTTKLSQKNIQPNISLFVLVLPLSLLTIAPPSILPIVLQFLYGRPNMFFTVLAYLPSLQSSLWLKQIAHCKINRMVALYLILGLLALLVNGGEEVSSRLGIRTL
jgi:hypothetical protein